ncbi:hypothetical protein [Kribbella soli]|uniref:hypothetical protein n=1 Tax=Kribbella soli TaxID=1124743 RepID=UPI001EDC9B48|nr:hypothetical protein [Kribbella soli]
MLGIQQLGDALVTDTFEVYREDPFDGWRRHLVDGEDSQPVALLRLPRVRVWSCVDDLIAVRRTPALMLPVDQNLSRYRGSNSTLHVLPLRLRQATRDRHRHVVHRVLGIESSTEI